MLLYRTSDQDLRGADGACQELCSRYGFATGHGDTVTAMVKEIDHQIGERHDTLLKRIARLEADLNECREYLETEMDVVDGDYGVPEPNRAMALVSMIDQTLYEPEPRK